MTLYDGVLAPQHLVYLAGAFYVAGLAITNQIVLRLFLLAGTVVYLIYYSMVADNPLWEAIYVSLLIGTANLSGLTSLIARNSRLAVPREHADIYFDFPHLPPGDFRALVKLAKRYTVSEDTQITTENRPGQKLYYLVNGSTLVRKADQAFVLPPKIFIGEIAFMLGQPSSASAWLQEGSEVLEWNFADLRRKCARKPRFNLALEAAISVDLARKVASSMGRDAIRIEEIPKKMVDALDKVRMN